MGEASAAAESKSGQVEYTDLYGCEILNTLSSEHVHRLQIQRGTYILTHF